MSDPIKSVPLHERWDQDNYTGAFVYGEAEKNEDSETAEEATQIEEWMKVTDEELDQEVEYLLSSEPMIKHMGPGDRPSGSGQEVHSPKKLSETSEMYFHRAYKNTDAVLSSGILRASEDNFAPYVHQKLFDDEIDSPRIVFSAVKSQLSNFRSTMTNQVASNLSDLKVGSDLLVLIHDPSDNSFTDVTPQYLSGVKSSSELLSLRNTEENSD